MDTALTFTVASGLLRAYIEYPKQTQSYFFIQVLKHKAQFVFWIATKYQSTQLEKQNSNFFPITINL